MLTLLLALFACATTPEAPAAPASEAHSTQTQLQTLTLEPHLLSWDDASGTVTYSPGGDRMAAEYTRYVLSAASVEAVLGGRPEAPVTVEVEVRGPEITLESPRESDYPQPQGGFQITTWTGQVTRRVE